MSCDPKDKAIRPGARKSHSHPGHALPAPKPDRGSLRVWWRGHGSAIAPWAWIGAADTCAAAIHAMPLTGPKELLGAACASAAAGMYASWHLRKRRPAIRNLALKAWAAGSVWEGAASALGPAWFHGAPQWTLIAGGAAFAGAWLHRTRRPDLAAAKQERAPALPDPRETQFLEQFCGANGALSGAVVENFADVAKRGFQFEVSLAPWSAHTVATVTGLLPQIAKLYDVPADKVSAGYVPGRRSERRAQVIVVTAADATARARPWDGQSTYDPGSGTIQLGHFLDGKPARWLLHRPGSGAAHGVVGGATGAGKSGTLHVLATEAGLAKMCARCGTAATCERCDMRRICAVWMGDPQCQPFAVWRGRADLTGWGPEGCVTLLGAAVAVMKARSSVLSKMRWTDERGRENTGKGWFDPEPGFPLILVVIDEWPMIVNHHDRDMRDEALHLASLLATGARKAGIALVLGSQILDLSQMGIREIREMLVAFNAVAHRCDSLSSSILGIKGDPTKLDENEPGAGYMRGPDNRPETPLRTKHVPEHAPAGVDVRHMAEIIAQTPVEYDLADLLAMEAAGVAAGGVVERWQHSAPAGTPAPPQAQPAPPPPAAAPGFDALPAREEAEAVRAALADGGSADIYDLMVATELALGPVTRAAGYLVASGDAVQAGDMRWALAE